MVTRILPPHEWPRISETGCLVDKQWQALATRGYVVAVERMERILGLAFVFVTDSDDPHVDGVWIAEDFRKKVSVARNLLRGIKGAMDLLGTRRVIPLAAAPWIDQIGRRQHGLEL